VDRVTYQRFVFELEGLLADDIHGQRSPDNTELYSSPIRRSIVRLCHAYIESSLSQKAERKKLFLTFRRSPDVVVPGWAFRKPGHTTRIDNLE